MGKRIALSKQLMGANELSYKEIGQNPISYAIGQNEVYKGEKYNLNRLPSLVKGQKGTLYSYSVKLESDAYTLLNKKIELLGEFSFTVFGNLEYFVDLIISSINSIESEWIKGGIPATDGKTLTFENQDCRNVLNKLYEEFGFEWRATNKEISFASEIGTIKPYTFSYGNGNGAYTLTRQSIDSKNTVTRVYGRGSEKNLPDGYAYKKLRIPTNYLQDTSEYPHIVEGIYTNEDIYPHFEGAISSVSGDGKTFIVASMDFNLNDYLNQGVSAKCVFQSGRLSGYTFEIASFDNALKQLILINYTDSNGVVYPNPTALPEDGDEITFVDIYMPSSYVTNAENELVTKTQEYLNENKKQRVSYTLDLDPSLSQSLDLDIGDSVTLVDSDYNINRLIRVKKINIDNINFPQKIIVELSDFISISRIDKVIADQNDTIRKVVKVDASSQEGARRNYQNQKILQEKLFDPDSYFDNTNIKPNSIETLLLAVGAKSQNFKLSGVKIEPNFGSNENTLNVSSGILSHRDIQNSTGGYDWAMVANNFDLLTPATSYYLYAKCSKTANTGIWVLSENQEQSDQATDYFFWVGILYPVADGRRDYDMTAGMTFINGDTITTGKIQSSDQQNYIDLDLNKFRMGNQSSSLDWNVTAANALTVIGAAITGGLIQTAASGKRVVLDGSLNNLEIFSEYYDHVLDQMVPAKSLKLDDDIYTGDEPTAGIEVRGMKQTTRVMQASANGFFANFPGTNPFAPSSGINGRATGAFLGLGNLEKDIGDNNILAGLYAMAYNSNSNPANTYGAWIDNGVASSFFAANRLYSPPDTQGASIAAYAGFIELGELTTERMIYLPKLSDVQNGQILHIMGYPGKRIYIRVPDGDAFNGYNRRYFDFKDAFSCLTIIKRFGTLQTPQWRLISSNLIDIFGY